MPGATNKAMQRVRMLPSPGRITKLEVPSGIVDPYASRGALMPKHLTPKVYADAKTTPLAVDFAGPINRDDDDDTSIISFSFGFTQ